MQEKVKNRNIYIDVLKGLAVLAVLLGHAIQRGLVINYTEDIIFKIIYTFHMPLFMFLSGYVLKKFFNNINIILFLKNFAD